MNELQQIKAEAYDLTRALKQQQKQFEYLLNAVVEITEFDAKDGITLEKLVECLRDKVGGQQDGQTD